VLLDVDLDGAATPTAVANTAIRVPVILAALPVATGAVDGHGLGNGSVHALTTTETPDC